MIDRSPTIVLFGSAKSPPGSADYQLAFDLGRELADKGYRIANGGYGGIMQASAQGASQAGGHTIGVTCSAFGRGGPNEWIDEEIRTANLNERLNRLVELGDAYIVLPGGTGTLLELALVWESINKGFLPQRPIICIAPYWRVIIIEIVANTDAADKMIYFAETVQDAVKILSDYFKTD